MKDCYSVLRRQILEDVLGEKVEEYENFHKLKLSLNKRQHRKLIPLWKFLLHLLNRDKKSSYIEWSTERALEFRIIDTSSVAELWGSMKNKSDMTYEKLGRAMRYYYGKSIIEKVNGKRYSYRFILSRRTKKYISQFVDVKGMKLEPIADTRSKPSAKNNMSDDEDDENMTYDTPSPTTSTDSPPSPAQDLHPPSPTKIVSIHVKHENTNDFDSHENKRSSHCLILPKSSMSYHQQTSHDDFPNNVNKMASNSSHVAGDVPSITPLRLINEHLPRLRPSYTEKMYGTTKFDVLSVDYNNHGNGNNYNNSNNINNSTNSNYRDINNNDNIIKEELASLRDVSCIKQENIEDYFDMNEACGNQSNIKTIPTFHTSNYDEEMEVESKQIQFSDIYDDSDLSSLTGSISSEDFEPIDCFDIKYFHQIKNNDNVETDISNIKEEVDQYQIVQSEVGLNRQLDPFMGCDLVRLTECDRMTGIDTSFNDIFDEYLF